MTVTQRGEQHVGRGELQAASPIEVGTALRTALDNGATAFELGLKVKRGYQPRLDDLTALQQHVIRIDFAS